MSAPFDQGERFEVKNAAGQTVGVFLPSQAAAEQAAERDRLREEVENLKKEVARLEGEGKELRKAVYALMPQVEVKVTAEDIAEMDRDGIPMEEIIAQIERELPGGSDPQAA